MNARSLVPLLNVIENLILDQGLDILAISESCLNKRI